MARNITDTEWQSLNILSCSHCNLKTSDEAFFQAHPCKPRRQQITPAQQITAPQLITATQQITAPQQITAGVSYSLASARFTCSLCTVELSEVDFCEHLEGHVSLRPYVCKYCKQDFATRADVCEHLRCLHEQNDQVFVLKLSGRTKEIMQKAKNNGKEFYKPLNVQLPKSSNANFVSSRTLTQNLTAVPGPLQKISAASHSQCNSLGSTSSSLPGTVPTVNQPVPSRTHFQAASQPNSSTLLTSLRPQPPGEQRRYFIIMPTQPQTGLLPAQSAKIIQTQAPSFPSQNVSVPTPDIYWGHQLSHSLPGQDKALQTGSPPIPSASIVQTQNSSWPSQNVSVPTISAYWRHQLSHRLPQQNRVSRVQPQRTGMQLPVTTLPNPVTQPFHSAVPSITESVNTREVFMVTNKSSSINNTNNSEQFIQTGRPGFHVNQVYLSSPSVQNATGNQMAPPTLSSVPAYSLVTSNTHKAGSQLAPAASETVVNQPLLSATFTDSPPGSTDMSVNSDNPTENDASRICKVSIQPFAQDIKSSIESDNVSGDVSQGVVSQTQQMASSSSTEVEHEQNSQAVIKSEDSTDGDTDCPLQIRIENIMSLSLFQDPFQCLQNNAADTSNTDSPVTETVTNVEHQAEAGSDTTEHHTEIGNNTTGHHTETGNNTTGHHTEAGSNTTGHQTETRNKIMEHQSETGNNNTTQHQSETVTSNTCRFLGIVKGYFVCLACRLKWCADSDSFFKHVWEKHTHEADMSCCPAGYSPYCARLKAVVQAVYDRSHETMPDKFKSYFTPKASIETEDVQSVSLVSENSSLAAVSCRTETVQHMNMREAPLVTECERPSSAASKRDENLPAKCISSELDQNSPAESASCSTDRISSPPVTLISDQHSQIIENNSNLCALTTSNELEDMCTQDIEGSVLRTEDQTAHEENTCSDSELRNDLDLSHENLQTIMAIDVSSTAATISSHYTKENSANTYEDISDDESRGRSNGNHKSRGSIDNTLLESPYSDEMPLDLSKKTTHAAHGNVTTTTSLSENETAAVSSVTYTERVTPEMIETTHDSLTVVSLSAAETSVTSSLPQTAGLMSEIIRKSNDTVLSTLLSATETAVENPRRCTERLSIESAGMGDDDDELSLRCFYACGICLSSWPKAVELEIHIHEVHALENNFPCTYCGFTCSSSKNIIQHLEDHITVSNRKTFSCSLLENSDKVAQFENNDMKFIIRMLKTSLAENNVSDAVFQFVCNVCQSEFDDLGKLGVHLQESLLKVIGCKHCESFFLNSFSWQKHMAAEHVDLPRMYSIKQKLLCCERKLPSSISHEDGLGVSNTEKDQEATVQENQRGTPQESHTAHETTSDILGKIEIDTSNVIENSKVNDTAVASSETRSSHEEDVILVIDDDIQAKRNPGHISTIPKLLDLVKSSRTIKSVLMSAVSLNTAKMPDEQDAVLETELTSSERRASVAFEQCVPERCVSIVSERIDSTYVDLHGLMRPGSIQGDTELTEIVTEMSAARTAFDGISTVPPVNDCLKDNSESSVVQQRDAVSEVNKLGIANATCSDIGDCIGSQIISVTGAGSGLDQTLRASSQKVCDVTSGNSSDGVGCKVSPTIACGGASRGNFDITSNVSSFPVKGVSEFGTNSTASIEMPGTRTRLDVLENNNPDIGTETFNNQQECGHSSQAVLENSRRSTVQYDLENRFSTVVEDSEDPTVIVAVNKEYVSQTVFLSQASTDGGNTDKEEETDILAGNIQHTNEVARNEDAHVSVSSITENCLNSSPENSQKSIEHTVFQRTIQDALTVDQACENAHGSGMGRIIGPFIDSSSPCKSIGNSMLETVAHGSGDIPNPVTIISDPDYDSCCHIDFYSSKGPVQTLEVSECVESDETLENDTSRGHGPLNLNIDKISSNKKEIMQVEKQAREGETCHIPYNEKSISLKGGLSGSSETSCMKGVASEDIVKENLLNSPSHGDNLVEENNTASENQSSQAANETEINGLSDEVNVQKDLNSSVSVCACGALISAFTDFAVNHSVQAKDKSRQLPASSMCVDCRLVAGESSHPENGTNDLCSESENLITSKCNKSLSEKAVENCLRALKRKAPLVFSENNSKMSKLENVSSNGVMRSQVVPEEISTAQPTGHLDHPKLLSPCSKPCVISEQSMRIPVLESSSKRDREMLDLPCKRKLENQQCEAVPASKKMKINFEKHSQPEKSVQLLERSITDKYFSNEIQMADITTPDSPHFRCSVCTFFTSHSYTEVKQHIKSQHPQDMSVKVCRIHPKSSHNAAGHPERLENSTQSSKEVEDNLHVNDITAHKKTRIDSETGDTGVRSKSELLAEIRHTELQFPHNISADVCRVDSISPSIRVTKLKAGMCICLQKKCRFACHWDQEKMKQHIDNKHPYYSCGHCKAPYSQLAFLRNHLKFVHRGLEPRIVRGTIELDQLFKCVDSSCNGQSADCKDITSQSLAKKKRRQSSTINAKNYRANARSELKSLEIKGHGSLQNCDLQSQPTEVQTGKDENIFKYEVAQPLKMSQSKLAPSKSESILELYFRKVLPMSEHETGSVENLIITPNTDAVFSGGDPLSAKTDGNVLKTTVCVKLPRLDVAVGSESSVKVMSTVVDEGQREAKKSTADNSMSSTFAKTVAEIHRVPPSKSFHTKTTVADSFSHQPAECNANGSKVTEYQKSNLQSTLVSEVSKYNIMKTLGPSLPFQHTVRKESSATTPTHLDKNASLHSRAGVKSSDTVKTQEINSDVISHLPQSHNRSDSVDDKFPEMCSETASNTMLLCHTNSAAELAIVTPVSFSKIQDEKHWGIQMPSQLEAKTAAEGDQNKQFGPEGSRTDSENLQSVKNRNKTESMCENTATILKMNSLDKNIYPLRCKTCSIILKCLKDAERHYIKKHPEKKIKLVERKSNFVYSNSGRCLQSGDIKSAPTDSYLCYYCAFRHMKRSGVEAHIMTAHPERRVKVFSLHKPSDHSPHKSRCHSPTPSQYCCCICKEIKYSEFQFRLHLASHSNFTKTTQLTTGASFLCHTCGYLANSNRDLAQHTGEHMSERRFKCFMCDHDSHHKQQVRTHIRSVHSQTIDDDVGIIDRFKQRSVDLRPRLVNIDPRVSLVDPFRQHPNYLQKLVMKYDIKMLDLPGNIFSDVLAHEHNEFDNYFDVNKFM